MKSIELDPRAQHPGGATGQGTTVGLLDMTVVGDVTLQQNIVKAGGVSTFTDGHGAAVASIIYGAHDGQGVMGIAPNATVVAYNPFDSTGTANWSDITKGVQALKAEGANVVNMSLGVPGSTFDPGWNGVFTSLSVTLTLKNTVFVMAAGNDGVVQQTNIPWSLLNPAFIVVGSVDPSGNISNFSNQPGKACLTPLLGICTGDYLMNHFIVAPGEMIMVDNGHGGTVRESGTIIRCPDRSRPRSLCCRAAGPGWSTSRTRQRRHHPAVGQGSRRARRGPGLRPWRTGRHRRHVAAELEQLVWYEVQNGKMTSQTSKAVISTYQTQNHQAWDATGAYFYAFFEPIGLTERDFAIPLSSKLVGQTMTAQGGSQQMFQQADLLEPPRRLGGRDDEPPDLLRLRWLLRPSPPRSAANGPPT